MKTQKRIGRRGFICSSAGTSIALAACSGPPLEESTSSKASGSKLVDKPQVKRDFDRDGRSKKVVFVAHCILNQNARHVDCADFPAVMEPLLSALKEKELGIIQMPCPELMALGLGRDRDVPPLDTVRDALELPEAPGRLEPLIDAIVYQIREYQFQELEIVGIIGKNGSPACGVETTSLRGDQVSGEGVFVRLLKQRIRAEGLNVDLKGVDDHRQEETIAWVAKRA